MICKDCIHDEMCQKHNNLVQIDEHTWDEYVLIDEVERFCEHFKNKADVAEVKHAKWKRVKGEDYWTCSNCCTVAKSEYDEYCRHCGAKMDGGKI